MEKLSIKNKTQVQTWWRWYLNGEEHRFLQPVGWNGNTFLDKNYKVCL